MTNEARSIWGRPERGSRGPAPERNLEEITTAAVAIADASGLAAVSMRQVAIGLGTGPASLYRYLGSRDDLLDLMADSVTGQIDLGRPAGQDWLDDMTALATATKAVYLRHPWMITLVSQRTPLGPNTVEYLETALAYLEPTPAGGGAKLEAIAIMSGLVRLFAAQELGTRDAPDSHQTVQEAVLLRLAADGRHPLLRAALADRESPVDGAFRRAIRRVLDGLLTSGT